MSGFSVFKLGGKTLAANITDRRYDVQFFYAFARSLLLAVPEKVLDYPAGQALAGSFQAG